MVWYNIFFLKLNLLNKKGGGGIQYDKPSVGMCHFHSFCTCGSVCYFNGAKQISSFREKKYFGGKNKFLISIQKFVE